MPLQLHLMARVTAAVLRMGMCDDAICFSFLFFTCSKHKPIRLIFVLLYSFPFPLSVLCALSAMFDCTILTKTTLIGEMMYVTFLILIRLKIIMSKKKHFFLTSFYVITFLVVSFLRSQMS